MQDQDGQNNNINRPISSENEEDVWLLWWWRDRKWYSAKHLNKSRNREASFSFYWETGPIYQNSESWTYKQRNKSVWTAANESSPKEKTKSSSVGHNKDKIMTLLTFFFLQGLHQKPDNKSYFLTSQRWQVFKCQYSQQTEGKFVYQFRKNIVRFQKMVWFWWNLI